MMMKAGPGNTISAMPNARTLAPITAAATLRAKENDEVVVAALLVGSDTSSLYLGDLISSRWIALSRKLGPLG
jgi:hypothetical protein